MQILESRLIRKLRTTGAAEKLRQAFEWGSIVPFNAPPPPEALRANDPLSRLFYEPTDRLVHKWPHYLPIYHRYFSSFRDGIEGRPLRLLEVGVSKGGSLRLWRRYFGPNAIIFGVDIDPTCEAFNGNGAEVRIGSQDDSAFLLSVVEEMGRPDIIVDDGSHIAKHQLASFEILFPLLAPGGLYVVEDLHTAYWRNFGGSLRSRRSFIGHIKSLIDDIHHWYSPRARLYSDPEMEFTGLHIFDSIAVIEKGRRARPITVQVPSASIR